MKLYFFKFILIVLLITSCKKDDAVFVHPNLGDYKLKSLTSNIPLDLNFDNIQSTDFKQELSMYIGSFRAPSVDMQLVESYYNSDEWYFHLGGIPKDSYHDHLELLDFRLRYGDYSKIIILNDNVISHIDHVYSDLFVADSTWLLENKYPYPYNIELINDVTVNVKISQLYFDTFTNEWVDVDILGVFEKN